MSWLFDGRKRRRGGGDGLEAAAELRQIDSEEMKSHATPDSCWVSIDGLVYDVTNFPVDSCLLYLFGASRGTHAMQRFREWQMAGDGGSTELPTDHIESYAA